MLDILTNGFKKASESLQGKATLSKENLSDALTEIRKSLLAADVEYLVAKKFLAKVQDKALGEKVQIKAGKGKNKRRVSAGDHFVNICKNELEELMGQGDTELSLPSRLASIMLVGLQGTGKTTTSGKLAKFLHDRKRRKPLLVAADIYRPAAVEQLKVIGRKIGVPVFHVPGATALEICHQAHAHAKDIGCDTIILDTAGRLTIDQELMQELADIKTKLKPDATLLVCDAMMGQDAVTTAQSFNERLELSGFIMTKLDGDTRGGAALSIRAVTGAPIKFLATGEGMDAIEAFRPEGLASRILGMGDIVGLMDDFDRVVEEDREEDTVRMLQGKFNLNDFYEQISTIQKMGSLKDVAAKLPMQDLIPKDAKLDDRELLRIKSMIDSMTPNERLSPNIINPSRVKRIAAGSGRNTGDVQGLLQKFHMMRKMIGGLGKKMGVLGRIPGANQLMQMNRMRQMMQGGAGALPRVPPSPTKRVDREKLKRIRRAVKNSRKKNRKKCN